MRNFHIKKTSLKEYCPTINVETLWSLVGNEAREHYAKDKAGKAPVIDLVRHVSLLFLPFLVAISYSLSSF